MGNWKKYQGETHYAGDHRGRRPCCRKPPSDNRNSYVPKWEKKFCTSVGSVSWRKLLEAKRYMYLHDNVMQWDDSACQEAFNNAKSKFWADINGLPCNISLPDPNMYIDDVDWDSSIDPELLLDLEKEQKARTTEVAENDQTVILSDALQLNQSVAPTGWWDAKVDWSDGKCYDQFVIFNDTLQLNQSFACTGWGDAEADLSNGNYNDHAVNLSDTLQLNQSFACTGWGDAEADLSNGNYNDHAVYLSDTPQLNQSFACTGWRDAEADLTNEKYNYQAVNLNDTLQLNQSFACTGWGNAEADLSNGKCNPRVEDSVNQWEEYCIQKNDVRKEYEWGNGWDGWNQWEDHANGKQQKMDDRADGSWET